MTTVEVLVDEVGDARVVGRAHVTRARGQISTTFLYDPAYLADGGMNVDPALLMVAGSQYQAGLIRAFADSAPDRWGRNLIEKAERVRAREESKAPRRLDDLDSFWASATTPVRAPCASVCRATTRFLGSRRACPGSSRYPSSYARATSSLRTTIPRTPSSSSWTRAPPVSVVPGRRPPYGSTTAASPSRSSRTPVTDGT